MKLTKEEEQLVLQHRQEKEKDEPKKIGYLKHDLYSVDSGHYELGSSWLYTETERDEEIQDFINHFNLICPINTEFECYITDGIEDWYADDVEGMSQEWAEEHLKDIKPIKKKRK